MMKTLLGVVAVIAAGALIALFVNLSRTSDALFDQGRLQQEQLKALQDSIGTLRKEVAALRELAPGLGEYMTAIQLHMAKLWYAEQASNWGLANYELHELAEAVDGAESLHAIKNKVDVTSVLEAVENTELPLLAASIDKKTKSKFTAAYTETLVACNSCHRASGNSFIRLTTPTIPPVGNQRWAPGSDDVLQP